jgi:DNA helicase-2/ATP-dependent DNA helicase PcrA
MDGDLVACREDGDPVEVYAFASQRGEYKWVADNIANRVLNEGVAPESIAFIAKDGNELKAMGQELTKRGIPSQLLTPEKVNMNSRVIAAIALAEFIANTETTQCAFDFLNTIQDGQLFEKTDAEITEAIESFKQHIESQKGEKSDIDQYFEWMEQLDASDETYKQFADKLGKFTKFDDLLDYARAMKRFGQKESYRRKVYAGKGVILTTVHSSKGLEWPIVFVSVTKFNNVTKLEESRRVLFTAVTRARDELICTGVANKNGRAYIEEIFGYAGKEWEVIPDEEDTDKQARKERAAEVREIMKKARKDTETFRY